jgi:hypothetical protein
MLHQCQPINDVVISGQTVKILVCRTLELQEYGTFIQLEIDTFVGCELGAAHLRCDTLPYIPIKR